MRLVVLICLLVSMSAAMSYAPDAVSAGELSKQTRAPKPNQPVTPVQSKAAPPTAEVITPAAIAQGPRVSDDIKRLEEQVGELQRQLREARAVDRAYVDAQLQRASQAKPSSEQKGNAGALGNMVFFKAGVMNLNHDRGSEIFTDTLGATGTNGGNLGWYAGAGLELALTKDVWGLMNKTWALGEIGVQFNRIASSQVNNTAGTLATGALDPQKMQLTMVTINVSPKIKFMEGSAFRPWIIPVGLDIHVISPPSNQTQYLDIGAQFGAGFEVDVYKAFKLGVDARYHLAADMTNTKNSYGQVGPYIGIAF
ncbi:hypothetical protein [Petrachloros mirabilis]